MNSYIAQTIFLQSDERKKTIVIHKNRKTGKVFLKD